MEPELEEPDNISVLKKFHSKGIEVIIVKGKNPSLQRNRGVEKASGDIIYFLDKDSFPTMENIKIIKKEFKNNDVDILGGPQILPEKGPLMEEIYYDILSYPPLVGKTASRYYKRGKRRKSDEGELILSNMAVRKNVFSRVGFFNEKLYPNEENDFLKRAEKAGFNIIYNPDFAVEKPMKLSVFGFLKQTFKYGFGRGFQTKRKPTFSNVLKFLFIFFTPLFIASFFITSLDYFLFAYILYDITIAMILSNWSFWTFFHYLFLIPLFHNSYSIGILFGLFSKNKYIKSDDFQIIVLK